MSDTVSRSRHRLPYRAPFDWSVFIDFHRVRAIAGVEAVEDDTYQRTIALEGSIAVVRIRPARDDALNVTITGELARETRASLLHRITRAFDLDTDTTPINRALRTDRRLRRIVEQRPGLRVPGSIDPFDQGVRAILGQQISVGAAVRLTARLCERWGEAVADSGSRQLSRTFPDARTLADADIASLGMPRARGRAINAFARACVEAPGLLDSGRDLATTLEALLALPGIGEWSANYIAMRAARQPDAFPASDVGILRGLADADGKRPTPREALAMAEAWRPWRAYAAQYLWMMDASVNQ